VAAPAARSRAARRDHRAGRLLQAGPGEKHCVGGRPKLARSAQPQVRLGECGRRKRRLDAASAQGHGGGQRIAVGHLGRGRKGLQPFGRTEGSQQFEVHSQSFFPGGNTLALWLTEC